MKSTSGILYVKVEYLCVCACLCVTEENSQAEKQEQRCRHDLVNTNHGRKKKILHVSDKQFLQDNDNPEFIFQHHIISASVASVAKLII